MLRRKISDFLKQWRIRHGEECLLVNGARQVGKSYAIEAFGKAEYKSFIFIDFLERPQEREIFEHSLDPGDIFSRMSLYHPDAEFLPGDTLIFLDEIQECPKARAALKYLAIDGRYDVIASGSLLGIRFRQMKEPPSLPVGYERQVTMHPLDFEEFLWANGYSDDSLEALKGYAARLEPVPSGLNEKFMRLLREYLAVGGMPAVVEAFVESGRNFGVAYSKQTELHELYLDDVARYATPTERVKARECYLSLPRQLAKENTAFRYSVVQSRGTRRKFDGSVSWVVGAQMALVCRAVSTPLFPLAAYETDQFRLYANDTGMLMAMYGFEIMASVVENTLKGPMKGGLYENLIAGMLAKQGRPLHYWRSSNSKHEIEFLADGPGASVSPIEVKASRGSTVSLNKQLERDDVTVGYKLVDGNVGRDGKKITLPLYMATWLTERPWGK